MFIHLGEDTIIRTEEVIAIFDYDLFQDKGDNKLFIQETLKNKRLTDVGHQMTKSVVFTNDRIYYSPFSPATLKRRSQQSMQSS